MTNNFYFIQVSIMPSYFGKNCKKKSKNYLARQNSRRLNGSCGQTTQLFPNFFSRTVSWIMHLQIILMTFCTIVTLSGSKMAKHPFCPKSLIAIKRNYYINFDQRFLQKGRLENFTFHDFPILSSQGTSGHVPFCLEIFLLENIAVEKCGRIICMYYET